MGRRQRNPRRMEGQEEVQPPSSAVDRDPSEDPGQTRVTTPASNPINGATTPVSNPTNGANTTSSRPTPGPPRERHREEKSEEPAGPREKRSSVFSRLGRSKTTAPTRSPDRFPDLRQYSRRGMLFGCLRPVPRDQLDPLPGACFNCKWRGHSGVACRESPTIFCYNFGRKEATLCDYPRCGEIHENYLWEQGSARRVKTPSMGNPRPPRRREVSPSPATQCRARRWDQPSTTGSKTSTSSRMGSTAIPAPPTSQPAATGHDEPPANPPTTRATPTTSRPTLVEYFSSISHLPGDLQVALLRAFLAQEK